MMKRKWLRRAILACLAPFALLLLAQWTSPWWLDLAAVKAQVTKIVAASTGGTGRYQRIAVRIFPMPRVMVTELTFGVPGTIDVEAHSVAAAVRLFPLFVGRVEPYELRLIAPRIRLVLADTSRAAPAAAPRAPFSVTALDSSARAALQGLVRAMPGLTVRVDSGHMELLLGRRAPILVEHLDVDADVGARAITASIVFTSAQIERFTADVRLAPDSVAGDLTITLHGVHVRPLGTLLGAGADFPVDTAVAEGRIAATLHSLRHVRVQVDVSTPRLALLLRKARIGSDRLSLGVEALTMGDTIVVAVRRLAVAAPSLSLEATLRREPAGALALDAALGDLDLATVQRIADSLAPAVPLLQGLPVKVRAGTLRGATLHASGPDLGSLLAPGAMRIAAQVTAADADIAAFHDLPVRGASFDASLEGGVLRITNAGATAAGIPVHDGRFRLDLTRDVPPLAGGAVADVDLAHAMALAPAYLPPSAVAQVRKVHALHGHATVAVQVTGDANAIVPSAVLSDLDVAARYDTIAFPLRVTRGTVAYTPAAIAVHALGGSVGGSAFSDLTARVALAGPRVITATAGTFTLDLPELFAWARRQPDLAKPLDGVHSVEGALQLTVTRLSLPLDSVKRASFAAVAVPHALSVDAPRYAPPLRLDGGAIAVTDERIDAEGVRAAALDAELVLGGGAGGWQARIDSAYASARGTVGPEALAWGFSRARLDSTLRLRGALEIAALAAEWRRQGASRAAGSVAVRGGPAVDLALSVKGEAVDIERVHLHDAWSDATLSGRIERAHFRAGCDGHLSGESVDAIFAEPPLRLRRLDCAFHTEGEFDKPRATTVSGTLVASRVRLPPLLPVPVTVDSLDLSATGAALAIGALRLSSGPSRVDVTGSVRSEGDRFLVDADVRGDTVIVPEQPPSARAPDSAARAGAPGGAVAQPSRESAAEKQSEFYRSLRRIPASGAVRVNIGFLRVFHYDVEPLAATASIEGTRVSFGLQRAALCGAAMSGGITLVPDSVSVKFTLRAKDIPVENAVLCLTNSRIDVTGTASVRGDYAVSAPMGFLRDHTAGSLELTAKDGRINKFDALANALKVINATQVLVGQASDIGTKGMAYSQAQVKVELHGMRVDLKEFSLDATGFEAAAHGSVDLESGAVDVDALIAPVQTANWIISHIPIIRDIFGGTVLAVPVKVRGTVGKPEVVPLGAGAVASRLVGILGNTLKLPTKLVPASSPKDTTAAPAPAPAPPPAPPPPLSPPTRSD